MTLRATVPSVRSMSRDDAYEEQQVESAAAEAGAIGGRVRYRDMDPAERPLVEAGEGVAEGFELSEQELIDFAEGEDRGLDPVRAAFPPEPEAEGTVASYGDADHERSADTTNGDW